MYNEYFGFKEAPFSIAPDPRYLYMTAQHREALAHLVYGLNSEGGCILLTGEVGTGKTTICQCLLEQIPDQARVALVLNPKVNEIELLETICDELNISYPESDNSLKTYTDRIYDFLIESNSKNEKTVLIIDEAQNLDSKVLEQLRLLTNLETHQRKLLQIIILGQPELLDILAKNEMRQLAQRITARFHLQPLTKGEVKSYISHRLAVAGQNIQLFPESSLKLLYKLSNGVPRLINIISDRALLGAYVENQHSVAPIIIKKAATEVFGELRNVERYQKNKKWIYALTAASCIAIASIALYFYLVQEQHDEQLAIISDIESNDISSASDENIQLPAEQSSTESTAIEREPKIAAVIAPDTGEIASGETAHNDELTQTQALLAEDGQDEVDITGPDPIDDILNNTADNKVAAYQALFNAWDESYDTSSLTTACKQAISHSLSCLHKQGNINSLKIHNRPAVLALINKQGVTQHVTITSIKDDLASIYSNNTLYTIALSELDRYWHGSFTLLWKKPEHYSSAITPGDRGDIVSWLYTQLLKIKKQDLPDMAISTYDDHMINDIKDFQIRQGLAADGVVGPVTIIHMNTLSGMAVPSLIPVVTAPSASSLTDQA